MIEESKYVKPNELRIGNYISYFEDANNYKDYHKVTNIDGEFSYCYNKAIIGAFLPIPLTCEILEKCGATKCEMTTKDEWSPEGHTVIYYRIPISRGCKSLTIRIQHIEDEERFVWENNLGFYIKYLHQLQNLYFALTQTELEITL